MLRHPDVGPGEIAFRYADDIWRVSREGGVATRVAGPAGVETHPKFSPDGSAIAFVGNYDGNEDVYVIPTFGGQPLRLTFHPAGEMLSDWGEDGRLVYASTALSPSWRLPKLFTTSPRSAPPARLPVPYGTNGAISADGEWLAYTPHSRDHDTWKRYRGGWASDIWLFNLKDGTSRRITEWEGTDSIPMWRDRTIYYLSDQGEAHRLNIWSYDLDTGGRRQVTSFADFDVKWPSIGPGGDAGEIVFQLGSELRLLDLESESSRVVSVRIPGDRPRLRARTVNASEKILSWNLSPTGKRAVFSARGDVWTVPAKSGSARNLTASPGVAERDAAWSPDGRWIAYFSDAPGEYELFVTRSDGKGEARRLTFDGATFRHDPVWSPCSKRIAFSDRSGGLFLHEIEAGETARIDRDPWASRLSPSWAPDSRWIAYAKTSPNRNISSIWIFGVESGETRRVTSDAFDDFSPVFDRAGDYLYFASSRDFSTAVRSDLDTDFVFADTVVLLACPLRGDVEWPWRPRSDEEPFEENAADDDTTATETGDDGALQEKELGIELEAMESRAVRLPVERGSLSNLAVNDKGQLLYVRAPRRGSTATPAIQLIDLEDDERREQTVLTGAGEFSISADGRRLLIPEGGRYHIVDATSGQSLADAALPLKTMRMDVDPRQEWAQVFRESWRILRDYFYDPNMHGVDWPAVRAAYEPLLEDCASAGDVRFLIGEMLAELNVGHATVGWGYDLEPVMRRNVGLLGADFELDNGAFRIARIVEGAAWDDDARGPLSRSEASEGDYLLAVNGVPLDVSRSPYAAFVGLAGQVVTLTVGKRPTANEATREIVVELLRSETELRFREWVERQRAHVDRSTDGEVGYVYVPDTSARGRSELYRQFIGQRHKSALIIDARWNAGGTLPQRLLELLDRPLLHFWARRDSRSEAWPRDAHHGPKCMLINGLAGSSGDLLAYYFRQAGLGPLIGTRTWGGVVGVSGVPRLIDGGSVSAPSSALFEVDGTWGIEGHGVEPDVVVVDDPALMVGGGDPQLEAAIRQMQAELARRAFAPPERPAYPDRSGMGVPPAQR